jgi:hypothetical protein
MKIHRPIALAFFPCLLAACTGTTPVKDADAPKKVTPSVDVHASVPVATISNAGAAKCTLQNVQQIGALSKNGGFALGFGQNGGLVAWSSPEGIRVKPLSTVGVVSGSGITIPFPKGVQPVVVAPVARGFAVIAKRIDTNVEPCPEAKPGEAAPPPCEKTAGHEYFMQLTDLDGRNSSAGRPFQTGLVDIDTMLPGDGRAFGLMTKNEVVWVQRRPDARLDAERIEFPSVEHVIPVFGQGPPAILLVDKAGAMQLLDERGVHEIEGSFVGGQPKAAPAPAGKPGAAPPAKPSATAPAKPPVAAPAKPASDVQFHSHWGPKGRIEVSRRVGDKTQYASIEKLVLRILTDSENPEIRESFANMVETHLENGKLRRTGVDKRPIGEDIDVRQADPAADTSRTRPVWTGNAFVFAHPSNPPHQAEAQSVGIVVATCGGNKP